MPPSAYTLLAMANGLCIAPVYNNEGRTGVGGKELCEVAPATRAAYIKREPSLYIVERRDEVQERDELLTKGQRHYAFEDDNRVSLEQARPAFIGDDRFQALEARGALLEEWSCHHRSAARTDNNDPYGTPPYTFMRTLTTKNGWANV